MGKTKVSSFEIDHTELTAPYILEHAVYEHRGVKVFKYDIRFITPNTTTIDDKILHSLEHILATTFKQEFEDYMIDLSPMGCKTGFYLTLFDCGREEPKSILRIYLAIMRALYIEVPEPTQYNCGSYQLHNIEGARVFLEGVSREFTIRWVDLEGLQTQAQRIGYKLVKHTPYIRRTLCDCGAKQVTTWSIPEGTKLECKKCNRSATGKTVLEAKLNWNKQLEVENEKD